MGIYTTNQCYSSFFMELPSQGSFGLLKRNCFTFANRCNSYIRFLYPLFCIKSILSSQEKWKIETSHRFERSQLIYKIFLFQNGRNQACEIIIFLDLNQVF